MPTWGGSGFSGGFRNGLPTGNPDPTGRSLSKIYANGMVVAAPSVFRPSQAGTPQAPAQQSSGNPIDWASLLQGAQSQSPVANVTSGITARPIATDSQVSAALSKYGGMSPRKGSGPFGATAQGLYNQESQAASVAAGRDMRAANQNHLLTTQSARASSGLNWGQLASRERQSASGQQFRNEQVGLSLLRALGVL